MLAITTICAALFALSGEANALEISPEAKHEVSFAYGSIGIDDPNWPVFAWGSKMGSAGVRVGVGFDKNLTALVGWHHSVLGGEVEFGRANQRGFEMALTTDQVFLGPKYAIPVTEWFAPYGTAQATVMRTRFRMDDDIDSDDNTNQYVNAAMAPGAVAAIGIEVVPMGYKNMPFRFATDLELGYAAVLPLQFEQSRHAGDPVELGDLDFGGFYLHWGAGVRF